MKTMEEIYKQLGGLISRRKFEEAEEFLLSCRQQAKEERAFAAYIAVGNELTGFYRAASRHEEALAVSEDVLLLLEELQQEDTEHFAAALVNAAAACRDAGLLEDARVNYVRALKILEQQLKPDDPRFIGLYADMGELLQRLGENEKAAVFLEKAADILSLTDGNTKELAKVRTSLALLYFTLDKVMEAQKLLEEAIDIFHREGAETDSHYPAALAGMGEACFRLGRLEKALGWYEQSMAEVEKHSGRNQSYALLCKNCAAICERLGLKDRRESFLQKEELLILREQ